MNAGAALGEAAGVFRVHLTNVTSSGAVRLAESLLPALERLTDCRVGDIDLPEHGPLATYARISEGPAPKRFRRWMPNPISRALECLVPAARFAGRVPMLVLGDQPVAYRGGQVVFVHTPYLGEDEQDPASYWSLKHRVARWLFRMNARRAQAFIVQTRVMQASLAQAYPWIADRIHVVAQPPPRWVISSGLRRTGPLRKGALLRLFYPAATYPHKNHRLLARIDGHGQAWPVERASFTIDPGRNPNPQVGWIRCTGFLSPDAVLAEYAEADALLFLSLAESYGLPLVEAMWVGLPIVCPDLPYARALCGDQAIYFDPSSIESLRDAIVLLHRRIVDGWWPDWSGCVDRLPKDWDEVARAMAALVLRGRRQE